MTRAGKPLIFETFTSKNPQAIIVEVKSTKHHRLAVDIYIEIFKTTDLRGNFIEIS